MRIAIYPAQAGKIWDGSTLEQEALGGSETAVICTARELARLGHEVYVFARGTPGLHADVCYVPFERARALLKTLPLDVLICSRDGLPLLWNTRASLKILWLHDLPQSPSPLPNADLYVAVSQWQGNLYNNMGIMPKERTRIIHNGVDLDLFHPYSVDDLTPENAVELVWTSNPERGLWYAERVLRLIQRHYPKARLHVYGRNTVYGWNDGCEHVFYPDNLDGLVLHHARNKAMLANALVMSHLFVYPTWWPETFCISALEAQAAGLPVVATSYGALPETVVGGLLVPGVPWEPDHLEAVAEATVELLGDTQARHDMQQKGLAYASTHGWDTQAQQWDVLMKRTLGMVL